MRFFIVLSILVISRVVFAQEKSETKQENNLSFNYELNLIKSDSRFYITTDTSKKIKLDSLNKWSKNNDNLIIFFFPSEDPIKKKHYINQVKEVSKNTKFKESFIIGVPYITGVKDEDNVYFEDHLVQDVECFIFTSNKVLLERAISLKKEFKLSEVKDVPQNVYFINIDKESICVREDRIKYIGDNLLTEFLCPNYSDKENIQILLTKTNKLEKENSNLLEDIKRITDQFKNLDDEVKKLLESNAELREKVKLDKKESDSELLKN